MALDSRDVQENKRFSSLHYISNVDECVRHDGDDGDGGGDGSDAVFCNW